jgi:hypothetical protein
MLPSKVFLTEKHEPILSFSSMSDKNQADDNSLSGTPSDQRGSLRLTPEVVTMDTEIDSWIVEEEQPVPAALKVIRCNDPDYGLTEDETDERNEFINWYMFQDYVLLLSVPIKETNAGFFIPDVDVTAPEYSAFNTHDFQDSLKPFNRYGYAMRKIMERVKDLATLHSCISSPEGRANVQRKYEALLEAKFRSRLAQLIERCQYTADPDRKLELRLRIAELTRRIQEAKRIWERYAPWDG